MFRTAGDLAFLLQRERCEQKKLSRAALETLAIIAYHQPVTRAEIEEIRGVSTSKGTLDVLLETGWVRMRGRRRTPGRPITYGTTATSSSISAWRDRRSAGPRGTEGGGAAVGRIPPGFSVPEPGCDGRLTEDEDPLTTRPRGLGLLTPGGGDD